MNAPLTAIHATIMQIVKMLLVHTTVNVQLDLLVMVKLAKVKYMSDITI